ncbi:MAG: class I SAM-dependent methyltransferase [Solirubrobacterales bacterium]|nr:class I SAM-dependent methyltransferase [Solirubrobacterales bacterium]
MWRRLVLAVIGRLKTGQIEFIEGDRVTTIGQPGSEPTARVEVFSSKAWRRMVRGSTGMAEGYINREWDCDDLVALGTVAGLNLNQFDLMKRRFRFVLWPFQKLGPLMPRTTRRRGKKQIAAHYDLGNDLFSLFLDESMNYSSAVYGGDESISLEQAQIAKMDQIAEQLDLSPETHLLEIGTGWGGLSIHLARRTGCRITTTTISKEQAALARERIREAGLSDRIEVIESDYRDLTGTYDRLVSIEMIEAVGWRDFPTYFAKCSSLLKPDGAMLLQSITIEDDAYEVEKASRSFISRYIFPGGCLPSMAEIRRCLDEVTDMTIAWSDELRLDYAMTLAEWRRRFLMQTDRLEALGYDDRFRRLWVLYLCIAEAGFRSGRNSDFQLLLAKPQSRSLIQLAGNAPAGISSGISPK